MRQKHISVRCLGRILQMWPKRNTLELLKRLRKSTHIDECRIKIDQTDRRPALRSFGNFRPRDNKRNVRSSLPKCMLAPIPLLTVMEAVIAPKNDQSIVGIGTRLESIQDAAHHGVSVTHAGQITVYRIFDRIQVFKFLMNTRSRLFDFSNLGRQIVEIIRLDLGSLQVILPIEIKIFFRTVIGVMRRVETDPKEKRLLMNLFQSLNRPVDPLSIRHLIFAIVRNRSPLQK